MKHVLSKFVTSPELDCREVLDDTDSLDAEREPLKLAVSLLPSQLSSSMPP